MYESNQIGYDIYGLVTFHPIYWGHACLRGHSATALIASPFSFAHGTSCICVFHNYTVYYDVVHEILIIRVISPADCDFLDLPKVSFETALLNPQNSSMLWKKPLFRVIEKSPMSLTAVYEHEKVANSRNPARAPIVTLSFSSCPTPLAVRSSCHTYLLSFFY